MTRIDEGLDARRLHDELDLARAEIAHLHDSLAAAHAVAREQWERADRAEAAIAGAEQRLEEGLAERETLFEETRTALDETRAALDDARATLAQTEAALASARADLAGARAEIAALRSDLWALRNTSLLRATGWVRRGYARVRGLPRPADTVDFNRGP